VVDGAGNVLSFDGRLDNFRELAAQLGVVPESTSDSMLVLKAFERWGEECFRKLTGDLAVVLWSEREDVLYLARDHAGARSLYYRVTVKGCEWATYLDTFLAGHQNVPLSDEYIATYLAGRQIRELTPYRDVFAVPPGSFLAVHRGSSRTHRHWSAFGENELAYQSDQDYDEEFLARFRLAVARRAEHNPGILAELSGGMDSTSIVCMSDHMRKSKDPGSGLLDTVSYYDEGEKSLDERQYFVITEAKRRKSGIHLNMAYSQRTFLPHDPQKGRYPLPGADSRSFMQEEQFCELVWSKGYRVILSGIGGDELLGGVPDPLTELSEYLIKGAWRAWFRQGIAWSLVNRDPLIETLVRTVRYTGRSYSGSLQGKDAPPWVSSSVRELIRDRSHAVSWRSRLKHYTPRQLDNERTWRAILETLPHLQPRLLARPEYRYPYLDRDLVDYLHRVPRAQLQRPGRRRAMMRRALAGIVPQEILERRRKAFQIRGPFLTLQRQQSDLESLFRDSLLVQGRYIEADAFAAALRECCAGRLSHWQGLVRTIVLEIWLRSNHAAGNTIHPGPSLAA
jgi:asparagine synthase (glutamine-hydrolysing)